MSNWKKFIYASDIHGDQQDKRANKALFSFIDDFGPDIRVLGGDLFDFAALRKKAGEEEKRLKIRPDYEAGREWLGRFSPNHFLLGNHDKRLWDLAESGKGPLSDLGQIMVEGIEKDCKLLKCPIYPWDKRHGIVRIGNLKCLHGFTSGVGAARKMAQVYGSCIFGHGHGIQMASIEGLDERTARMAGCLCKLDLDYVSASLGSLMWRHGWVYGIVNMKTGNYEAFQAQEIEGKFVTLTGMREL